jgi:hypothetical protein
LIRLEIILRKSDGRENTSMMAGEQAFAYLNGKLNKNFALCQIFLTLLLSGLQRTNSKKNCEYR